MADLQIPWSAPGARLEVSRKGENLTIVADVGGPSARTFGLPRSSLAGFGPAVRSPAPGDSLGLWVESWLEDESAIGSWRVVAADESSFDVSTAGGICRIVCRGAAARSPASRFRHDAHSLLNAIGMNADLLGMLASEGDIPKVQSAAARIRTSCDTLAALVSSRTREIESGIGLPVTAALDDAIRRAGIDGVSVMSDEAPNASALWCYAASRLMIEWAAWLARAEETACVGEPGTSREALELTCAHGAVSLYRKGLRLSAASPAFPLLPPAGAAAPELERAEPTGVLGEIGVGFGSWQTRGAAGVCIGIPTLI